jgi:HlyD family secretion protein
MPTRLLTAAALLSIGLTGFVVLPGRGQPSPAAAITPAAAEPGGHPEVIAGPGRVEPISEEVDVAAEISGRLIEVAVDEGDAVRAGQLIARLEHRDHAARVQAADARVRMARAELLRLVNGARPEERREAKAALAQADAALTHARLEADRHHRLWAGGAVARDAVDRADRDLAVATARHSEAAERAATIDADARADERARADAAVALAASQLAEAQAVLAKTEVRAPFDGVVLRRHRHPGESVSTDSPAPAIVTVADTRRLRVRVEVDERDIAGLAVGRRGWVTASAYGATRFPGTVVRVGAVLGRKAIRTDAPSERTDTRVLETLLELTPGTALPVGLRVDAFIER